MGRKGARKAAPGGAGAGRYLCGVCGGLHAIGEDPHQTDILEELREIEELNSFNPEEPDSADDQDF